MRIKKISVKNFKSFEELSIELGSFNALVGANASGKSNFLQIFRFISDISRFGTSNAVSLQGGHEFLMNINVPKETSQSEVAFSIELDPRDFGRGRPQGLLRRGRDGFSIEFTKILYEFVLKFNRGRLAIKKDELSFDFNVKRVKQKISPSDGSGSIKIISKDGEVSHKTEMPPVLKSVNRIDLPYELRRISIRRDETFSVSTAKNELLLEREFQKVAYFIPHIQNFFTEVPVYDIDTRLPKKAVALSGKMELEEDGRNLAVVLQGILKDKQNRKLFLQLAQDLLPFIVDLDVLSYADKSFLFSLKERYQRKQTLPASFISDGTINIFAIIVILFFQRKHDLIVIEEPERNIHPMLIERLVGLFKDASLEKQIIVTTHDSEIIKHLKLEDLIFVHRNKSGISEVEKPENSEVVRDFLRNNIGLDELFLRNFLV